MTHKAEKNIEKLQTRILETTGEKYKFILLKLLKDLDTLEVEKGKAEHRLQTFTNEHNKSSHYYSVKKSVDINWDYEFTSEELGDIMKRRLVKLDLEISKITVELNKYHITKIDE